MALRNAWNCHQHGQRKPIWNFVETGWPWFIAFRERGLWIPGVSSLFWAFDEILRKGLLWAMNEAPPSRIYIEMPVANRSKGSYGY